MSGRKKGFEMRASYAAITFFPRDYLGWSQREFLTPAQRGDLFDLIALAVDCGTGYLPGDHPIFSRIDPRVVMLATVDEGEAGVAVRHPLDLPAMLDRRRGFVDSRVESRNSPRASRRTSDVENGTERDGTARNGNVVGDRSLSYRVSNNGDPGTSPTRCAVCNVPTEHRKALCPSCEPDYGQEYTSDLAE
jgi:hypothetical protein